MARNAAATFFLGGWGGGSVGDGGGGGAVSSLFVCLFLFAFCSFPVSASFTNTGLPTFKLCVLSFSFLSLFFLDFLKFYLMGPFADFECANVYNCNYFVFY